MGTASASRVLMARMNGLVLTARLVLALLTLHGLVLLSTRTTCILGLSVPIRVSVTAVLASASASLVTKELLASVLCALTTVMTRELAGLRSILPARPDVCMTLLGMP